MAAFQIVSATEVDNFMSGPIVRATYDDNNDGVTDSEALKTIVEISEGLFLATIRGIYELPLVAPIDPFAKYVVLQIVHCQSIKRMPEVFRKGLKICEDVTELLKQLRKGDLQINAPLLAGGQGPTAYSFPARGYELLEDDVCD